MKKGIILMSLIGVFTLTNCKKSETPSDLVENTTTEVAAADNSNTNVTTTKTVTHETPANDIDPATAPEIAFKELEHNFGTIPYGKKVTHEFTFTNTGKTPLVIQSAKPSCGCTVPQKPEAPLQPGESGSITVEFNPKKNNGNQSSSVTVKTNTVKGSEILRIKANVTGAPGRKPSTPKANPTVSPNAPVQTNS